MFSSSGPSISMGRSQAGDGRGDWYARRSVLDDSLQCMRQLPRRVGISRARIENGELVGLVVDQNGYMSLVAWLMMMMMMMVTIRGSSEERRRRQG